MSPSSADIAPIGERVRHRLVLFLDGFYYRMLSFLFRAEFDCGTPCGCGTLYRDHTTSTTDTQYHTPHTPRAAEANHTRERGSTHTAHTQPRDRPPQGTTTPGTRPTRARGPLKKHGMSLVATPPCACVRRVAPHRPRWGVSRRAQHLLGVVHPLPPDCRLRCETHAREHSSANVVRFVALLWKDANSPEDGLEAAQTWPHGDTSATTACRTSRGHRAAHWGWLLGHPPRRARSVRLATCRRPRRLPRPGAEGAVLRDAQVRRQGVLGHQPHPRV